VDFGGCPDIRRFSMATFFEFMASPAGRAARVIAGLVLVVLGMVLGGAWWILAVVGLVPLLAGVFLVMIRSSPSSHA